MGTKARTPVRRIRYGVVGLGHIAQVAMLPAFAHARENSELVALFSDDATKRRTLGRRYGVEGRYDYPEFEEGLAASAVDAVYLALPNHLHREYTERAAAVGVHVLTEKPMAVTAADCQRMIGACDRNGVKLMVAYRLHFERGNMEAVRLATSGRLGELRYFSSDFSMTVKPGDIRLNPRAEGGGTLYDIGIYCINAARYLFQDEPVEVSATSVTTDDPRFAAAGVDASTSATLRFPGDRLATFTSSFASADVSAYRLVGTRGDLLVSPAYEYAEGLAHQLTVNGRTTRKRFPKRDQFAPQLVYFSTCIMTGEDPEPSGIEGLADVRIIEALYRSAEIGQAVPLETMEKDDRPDLSQEMRKPPVEKPRLVRTDSPSA